jgi:hypothetical protein
MVNSLFTTTSAFKTTSSNNKSSRHGIALVFAMMMVMMITMKPCQLLISRMVLKDNVEEMTPEEIEGELLYRNDSDNDEAVDDNVNVNGDREEDFEEEDDHYDLYNNANFAYI